MRRLGIYISTGLLVAVSGGAQSFEVASIKLSSGGDSYVRPTVRGTLDAKNVSLFTLIQWAYKVPDWRVLGGPSLVKSDWIKSERYDVQAKGAHLERFTGTEEMLQMMHALLADRFQLKVHHEERELPMYALVTAKSGPKLMPAGGNNCFIVTLTTKPADLHGLPPCGGFNGRKADINGLRVTTAALANQLEFILRSMVSDETGLAGHDYDMHLHWTPDDLGAGAPEPGNADASGPSIFTALQEQLGLKLESRKGPVDVIVIDRAEKASPN